MSFLINALASIFVFSIVIFIHELGHFVVAKKSGIKVKIEKKEVETQIVFDDDITRSILADNPSETYHSFFERAWLERLMRIDEFEALEKECALFYKTCEGVGKIDGITEEQKEYLAELKGMYKNVSEVIYEAVRREEYGY